MYRNKMGLYYFKGKVLGEMIHLAMVGYDAKTGQKPNYAEVNADQLAEFTGALPEGVMVVPMKDISRDYVAVGVV